jgi:hypothetical protein
MRAFFVSCFAATSLFGASTSAHQVAVSVQVSQPGVYGRVDIGRFPQILPQPQVVVLPQPVLITQPAYVVQQPPQPIYMWVPPGHQKHWDKHCYRYGACGQPVYFVRDDGYGLPVRPYHVVSGPGDRQWRERRGEERREGWHHKGRDKYRD